MASSARQFRSSPQLTAAAQTYLKGAVRPYPAPSYIRSQHTSPRYAGRSFDSKLSSVIVATVARSGRARRVARRVFRRGSVRRDKWLISATHVALPPPPLRRVDSHPLDAQSSLINSTNPSCLFPRRTARRCTSTFSAVRVARTSFPARRAPPLSHHDGARVPVFHPRTGRSLTPIPIALSTAEGVIYAKKDFNLPAHPEIKEVPNLQVRLSRGHDTDDPIVPNPKLQGHSRAACPPPLDATKIVRSPRLAPLPVSQVIKLMQSFVSKEFVKEIFSWRYYYWYLTNEGIEYLREYLNLSADVVPNTLKKSTRPATRPMQDERPRREGGRFGDRPGGREGYRSERPGGYGRGGGDKGGAPGSFNPNFAS